MAAIKWDEVGARLYETGVDQGVLWVMGDDGQYGAGVPWNGLTGVNENPEGGDQQELWADNILYATMRANEKPGGSITAYTYPDEFMVCDGSVAISTGIYAGQQKRKSFCFSWRTLIGNDVTDDLGYKIHIAYGCTASPSSRDYSTVNDSPDAAEFSWDYEAVPVAVRGHKPTGVITIDSTKVPEAKLTLITNALYGTDPEGSSEGTASRILMPNDILDLIA